jgi:hypothetical protein
VLLSILHGELRNVPLILMLHNIKIASIRKELSIYPVNVRTNSYKTVFPFLFIEEKVKQLTKARLCTVQAENIGMISGRFLSFSLVH